MANRFTKGNGLFGSLRTSGAARVADFSVNRPAAGTVADGASMALSATDVNGKTIIAVTPTTARNIQFPTAALLIAAVTGYEVGDTIEFTLINLAAASDMTATVNTGLTFVGSVAVVAVSSATWAIRIASATTVVCYRQ